MNIIDMHCDTLYQIHEKRARGLVSGLNGDDSLQVALPKLVQGDYLLQNMAVFVDMKEAKERFRLSESSGGPASGMGRQSDMRDGKGKDTPAALGTDGIACVQKNDAPYRFALELVHIFQEEIAANKEAIGAVTSFAELQKNEQEGRISALLTLEEGGICLGETEKLREFYRYGARMMTLTWNYENEIGYPASMQPEGSRGYRPNEVRTYGLKETGIRFVEEMEQLGMIVDVSHLSDDGFFDVCEHARKPFVASHSNARALCAHRRNLTDEMLRMLGERGGVAGLNLYPDFVIARWEDRVEQDTRELLEYLARHAIHMMDMGGSACVGLGSDFDGFHGASNPKDASRIQDLAWVLHRSHISDDRIDGILYQNVYRLYEELL